MFIQFYPFLLIKSYQFYQSYKNLITNALKKHTVVNEKRKTEKSWKLLSNLFGTDVSKL